MISHPQPGPTSPFSISAISEDKFNFVLKWVNEAFPQDLDGYSATSLCAKLLSAISVSLVFFPFPNVDDRPQDLDASHQYVLLSNSALQGLSSVTQSSFLEIEDGSLKTTQKARKYVKRNRQATRSIDMAPFRGLDLEVPNSNHEAKEMALEILMEQKRMLIVMMFAPYFSISSLTDSHSRILLSFALNHSQTRSGETIFPLPPSSRSSKTKACFQQVHLTKTSKHLRRSLLLTLKFNQ